MVGQKADRDTFLALVVVSLCLTFAYWNHDSSVVLIIGREDEAVSRLSRVTSAEFSCNFIYEMINSKITSIFV